MTVWLGYAGEHADRITKTFGAQDLADLEWNLNRATAVVPMREVVGKPNDVIGLRHDVDHDLEAAVRMAEWEYQRGFRSTYFVLHTAWYWRRPGESGLSDLLKSSLERIAELGHEIGIHNNALAEQRFSSNYTAADLLAYELGLLRGLGHEIVGTAAHGDERCYDPNKKLLFVNYDMFKTTPLSDFGLEYESIWLPRALYLSDSGGKWNGSDDGFPSADGQLHMLVHPDWWDI